MVTAARVIAQRVRWTPLVGLGLVVWSASKNYAYVGVDWARVFEGTAHTSCPVAFLSLIDSDWPIGAVFVVASLVTCSGLVDREHSNAWLAAIASAAAVGAFLGGLWILRAVVESSGSHARCLFELEEGYYTGGLGLLLLLAASIMAFESGESSEMRTTPAEAQALPGEGEFREL